MPDVVDQFLPDADINFHRHEVASCAGGAPRHFEQMLASLVGAVVGDDVHTLAPSPGDWGIDVLLGELDGEVEVWQAKYFLDKVDGRRRDQIVGSLRSATTNADRHGYRIRRWVLCMPGSFTPAEKQWWDGWKRQKQAEHRLAIELWDETKLRTLLATPAADGVRRIYYGVAERRDPWRDGRARPAPAPDVPVPATARWQPGDVVRLGDHDHLLHDDLVEWRSTDQSCTWRTVTAVGRTHRPVRIRQVRAERGHPAAQQRRTELRAQARLAGATLQQLVEHDGATTVLTARPPGPTWAEHFGPPGIPPDMLTAAAALAAAEAVAGALLRLHRAGATHRCLGPDAVVVPGGGRRARLRDPGFAGLAPSADDRTDGLRAPEQNRSPFAAGARTDTYQLAGLVHQTLTGHLVGPVVPPVRATLPQLPADVDRLLLRCLDPDPARRPPDLAPLRDALRAGRDGLLRALHG